MSSRVSVDGDGPPGYLSGLRFIVYLMRKSIVQPCFTRFNGGVDYEIGRSNLEFCPLSGAESTFNTKRTTEVMSSC